MKLVRRLLLALPIAFAVSTASHAGLYADDMSRCLVSQTSSKDKTDLIRWIFAVTALHPDVSTLVKVTDGQRSDINRQIGKLLERLLTQSCRKQTQEALKYEGSVAFQLSFQVLGQVAMQEMMSNQSVRNGFAEIGKHVDEKKMKELVPAK